MPRSLRFRYNPVFLPEYLSTILISIPISAVFMTTQMGGGRAAIVANPHLGVAIGLYLSIAGWLMMLTIMYRRQFCPVIFYFEGQGAVRIDGGRGQIALPQISQVQYSLGKFFGRIVRRVHVEDNRGNSVVFCDAIFHFEHIRRLLAELLAGDIVSFTYSSHDETKVVDQVKSLWDERHIMFPATETLGDVFSRLSWRGVCLLPVAVVDVLINLATILSLSRFQKHTLMVYSAPLALLVSAFIARFIYYYMFTSTTMNKPLGVKTR